MSAYQQEPMADLKKISVELAKNYMQLMTAMDLDDEGEFSPKQNKIGIWPFYTLLRGQVLANKARQVIELGVNSGGSTTAFLLGLIETGGRLWSCDTRQPMPPISFLEADIFKASPDLWTFEQGDTKELAKESRLVPSSCDILLVDAALENRFDDLVYYAPRVRPGGVIMIHDTNLASVRAAVEAYFKLGNRPASRIMYHPDNKGMALIQVY